MRKAGKAELSRIRWGSTLGLRSSGCSPKNTLKGEFLISRPSIGKHWIYSEFRGFGSRAEQARKRINPAFGKRWMVTGIIMDSAVVTLAKV